MSNLAPPGPGQAVEAMPSSEDRIVAAVSYLSWFVGMYLIVPVAVFFWARERSRFVTYHAIQAAVLALLMAVAAGVAAVGYFFVVMAGAMIGVAVGAELAFLLGAAAFVLLVLVLPAIATLYSAWCAFHGDTWRIPLIGRIADRVLAASDERMEGKP
jgi:uncharacterized membrane protein